MSAAIRSQHTVRPAGHCLLGVPMEFTDSFTTQPRWGRRGRQHSFSSFGVEGGQKSNGFVSVTGFFGLLLEVCSRGCDSSWDTLRRQVYLCRLDKAINGELVLPRVYFKLFASYKCLYIRMYMVHCKDWLPKLKNLMFQLQDWLLEWPLLSFTGRNDVKWHSVFEWWGTGITYFTSKTMPFIFPPSRQFTSMDIVSTLLMRTKHECLNCLARKEW